MRTKTPWFRASDDGIEELNGDENTPLFSCRIFSKSDADIAPANAYGDTIKECKENAEFIVKACNSFDDLLASCLALIEEIEAIEQEDGISMLGASRLHEAKIATLNAQGIVEEGYNDKEEEDVGYMEAFTNGETQV